MQSPGGVDIRQPPMQEGNTFPAGQQFEQPQAPNTQNLSKEEQRILAECRSEAYWYRSMPLSILIGGGALYAVKSGLISASQKFGPWPKVAIGIGVGYITGKMSYVNVCKEKFLREAPNSEFAHAIRKSQGEVVPEREADANSQLPHQQGLFPDGKDTANTGGDTGYSDYFVNPQNDKNLEERGRLGGTSLTYDQLRAQHRQKEMEKPHMQQGALIKPSTPVDPTKVSVPPAAYSPQAHLPSESTNTYTQVQTDPPEFSSEPPPPSGARKRTNKYGDEVFE
jgi:hypothetical protein